MPHQPNGRGGDASLRASVARWFGMAGLLAAALLTLAVVATEALASEAQSRTEREIAEQEAALLDCDDIATQRGAQALFGLAEEDRFDLDRDGDGTACETKTGGNAEDGTALGGKTRGDRDCMDLPSQAAAQARLREKPSDPWGLDPDDNGVACDITPTAYDDPASDYAVVAEARTGDDLDCKDFEFQQEAQMVYFRREGDPNGLDSVKEEDPEFAGNGFACEHIPVLASNADGVWAEGVRAEAAPSTPALILAFWPHGGTFGFLMDLAAAVLVISGLLGLLVVRRRASPGEPS